MHACISGGSHSGAAMPASLRQFRHFQLHSLLLVVILHPAAARFAILSYKSEPCFAQLHQTYAVQTAYRGWTSFKSINVSTRQNPDKAKLHVWCPNMVCCAALLDHRLNLWTVDLFELWHQNLTNFISEHRARNLNRILEKSPRGRLADMMSFCRSHVVFVDSILLLAEPRDEKIGIAVWLLE